MVFLYDVQNYYKNLPVLLLASARRLRSSPRSVDDSTTVWQPFLCKCSTASHASSTDSICFPVNNLQQQFLSLNCVSVEPCRGRGGMKVWVHAFLSSLVVSILMTWSPYPWKTMPLLWKWQIPSYECRNWTPVFQPTVSHFSYWTVMACITAWKFLKLHSTTKAINCNLTMGINYSVHLCILLIGDKEALTPVWHLISRSQYDCGLKSHFQVIVNTVMSLHVPKKGQNFFTSFSTMPCGVRSFALLERSPSQ
jgi:hypothetical protein